MGIVERILNPPCAPRTPVREAGRLNGSLMEVDYSK
jgi:hypothetical protein